MTRLRTHSNLLLRSLLPLKHGVDNGNEGQRLNDGLDSSLPSPRNDWRKPTKPCSNCNVLSPSLPKIRMKSTAQTNQNQARKIKMKSLSWKSIGRTTWCDSQHIRYLNYFVYALLFSKASFQDHFDSISERHRATGFGEDLGKTVDSRFTTQIIPVRPCVVSFLLGGAVSLRRIPYLNPWSPANCCSSLQRQKLESSLGSAGRSPNLT